MTDLGFILSFVRMGVQCIQKKMNISIKHEKLIRIELESTVSQYLPTNSGLH